MHHEMSLARDGQGTWFLRDGFQYDNVGFMQRGVEERNQENAWRQFLQDMKASLGNWTLEAWQQARRFIPCQPGSDE